jgi:DNA-binding MarR family transcriptional regulator
MKINTRVEIFHKYMNTSKMTAQKTHEKLEKVGLYKGQPPLLFALWEKDEQSGRELCQVIGVRPATVTKMVKRLKNAGFVTTRQDMEDSRVQRVCLTDKGRAVEDHVREIYEELYKTIFKGFDEEEMKSMEEFMDRIQENIVNG